MPPSRILFPGCTNNHMLQLMMELKGKLSHKLIKRARFGEQHFDETMNFLALEKNVRISLFLLDIY
jgi:serine/threonine-protein kinase PRP4